MKLGLIQMENVMRSSILTSIFQVNEYGRCKQESEHYYVECYLSFTKVNAKFLVLPIVVHQKKNFSQYIYFNIPLYWIFHHLPSSYNHLLTLNPEYAIYTKSSISHLSPFSTLKCPFTVTMRWDFSFLNLVSSQCFRIPLMDVSKTFSPLIPLQKPITPSAAKHDISIFRCWTPLFHSMSHPTNRAFTISLVDPKSCFLIYLILILYNHSKLQPLSGTRCICELFTVSWKHIDWPMPLGISSYCPIVDVQHISPF